MNLKCEISNLKFPKPAFDLLVAIRGLQMANCKLQVEKIIRAAWWFLRQVSGDAAYENYLRQAGARPVGADPCVGPSHENKPSRADTPVRPGMTMTREEFYLDSLRRRYSGISRCC